MANERTRRSRQRRDPAPVMWSPPALNARLEAELALRALPRSPWGVAAEARRTISRIVTQVEHRQLDQTLATAQLRALAARLREHLVAEEAARRPREWQLLANRHAIRY